ncbi:DNA adenine methylase [Kribbella sp. NPDC050241]|uniref:DNA adenine methylase n=1 Tax=Kribbella sp. NPDC050241 TaxID=3364115 RepID=UPI00379002A8
MTAELAPPFAYYGGKTTKAAQLAALLPRHRHYVEPFAGSLAVLLAKAPAPFETVNDLDGALMTFWRVLRDRGNDLARVCWLTPHSRTEHAASYMLTDDGGNDLDELELARRVWVQLSQGMGGTRRRTGWRHFQDPGDRTTVSMPDYLHAYVERMTPALRRLRRVSLEARPALEVIAAYGRHEHVCIYADPPYLGSTRSSRQYAVEMSSQAEHVELAETLKACRAAVVLSGYPSDLYDALYADWHRLDLAAFTGQAGTNGHRTEALWSNRPIGTQPTLWQEKH